MAEITQRQDRFPNSVVRRLPKYLMLARRLRQVGVEWVSSAEMADALRLTSSTVRQDLSYIDFSGVAKRGYSTAGLSLSLAEALGADHEICVVVVGAGNLGRALVQHGEFGRHGFRICGIFDRAPEMIGETVGHLTVLSMKELPDVVCGQDVDIGMIAVPSSAAQEVADRLILSGVRGLLNLTSTHVVAPKRTAVVDVRIVASLQELAYSIKVGG